MLLKVALDPDAVMPRRAHDADAGLDLCTPCAFMIRAGNSEVIPTGIHVEIPKGYYGKLESKSGLHVRHDIVCLGGIIDSGYTGEIVVKLYNLGDEDFYFRAGEKIVQLLILPVELCPVRQIELEAVQETERGANGFGSTGR